MTKQIHLLPDRTVSRPQNPPCHPMLSRGQTTNSLFLQTKFSQIFPLLTVIRATKAAHDWSPRNTGCPFYRVPACCSCRRIFRPIRASYARQLSCAQGHSVLPSSYLRVLHAPPTTHNLRTLTWFPWPPSCSGCSTRGSDSS